ncbi:hypothetical protein ACFQY4_45035 [Catellatospora bangladeshensis]|uniref:Uncharacterized protein n=1 Tax=Catellatospora bangladeshensis TaxID=310355 RepID=A0A8J3JRH4_9ACTN|nr:hypothetical protein [Catellatospora bangladeshensis]GIF83583.1 hypothetical protein Cba03nite_49320 [Catellatospora bangladeshensis]
MRRDQFLPAQQAHVVRAERNYLAFLPPPLPPEIVLDSSLLTRLSAAVRWHRAPTPARIALVKP